MATELQEIRRPFLLNSLDVDKPGLEISPLFRPTALKSEHNVFYTDYTSAEDSRGKHSNYVHDEIMDIDFVWTPGSRLSECVPDKKLFNWAIASHVLEHVPDPIGWMLEVFEVLEVGGVFSIALPDKRYCYDKFRRETEVSDLIDAWMRGNKIPSPKQIYDFLSRSVNDDGTGENDSFHAADKFESAPRTYSDIEALNFSINSWVSGTYLDVHCSVFTPESFCDVIEKLNAIGVINVEVSQPVIAKEEFYVTLVKVGEPRVVHPGFPEQKDRSASTSNADLDHARKAFLDAVAIQDELKERISRLESRPQFKGWVPGWLKNTVSR